MSEDLEPPAASTDPTTGLTDATDPRLAEFQSLNDQGFRRRFEAPSDTEPHGILIAEGWLAVEALLRSELAVRTVVVTTPRADRAEDLRRRTGRSDVAVLVVEPDTLQQVAGFDVHRGILASAARPDPAELARRCRPAQRLVLVEGVNDPENLGTLFRNAAAFGADAVLLDPTCCDPLTRRTIRVSLGHVLSIPWQRTDRLFDLPEVSTVALTPRVDAPDLRTLRITGRCAIAVGAEGPGLSDASLAAATHQARIAMAPGVDSLNVATASAVAMWHLFAPDQPAGWSAAGTG